MGRVLCVTLVALSLACGGVAPTGGVRAVGSKKLSRVEFDKQAVGKTPAELKKLFGDPSSTSSTGASRPIEDAEYSAFWYYDDKSEVAIVDPATNKRDRLVQVVIEKGKVKEVNH